MEEINAIDFNRLLTGFTKNSISLNPVFIESAIEHIPLIDDLLIH